MTESGAQASIAERAQAIQYEVLLPKKSEKKSESFYKKYTKWLQENNLPFNCDEDTLLTFFHEILSSIAPTTLWSYLSMLKSTVAKHHNIVIPDYYNLKKFIKRKNESYEPKQAAVLETQNLEKFLVDANDFDWLAIKVGRNNKVLIINSCQLCIIISSFTNFVGCCHIQFMWCNALYRIIFVESRKCKKARKFVHCKYLAI